MLGPVVMTVLLTTWVVNDRIADGAAREAQRQARARGVPTSALYAERAATLVANAEAATLEAGALHLEREPVRVERIAQRVVTRRSPLAPNHELRIETAPGLPLAAADPLRVEQVITNLIDNTIKYSPGGGPVTVRIGHGVGGAGLMVSVSDRGVGLAAEQAARVFERFYRAGDPVGGSPRGVGLGLFLRKRLVEAQGGRIWVESAPGVGSTFRFTLPILVETAGDPDRRERKSARLSDEPVASVGAAG